MVIPMGPMDASPPSDYALNQRKFFTAVAWLQALLSLARFGSLDIIGGMCLLLTSALGYMCSYGKPPMQMRWVVMWGFLCFINGIFDTVLAILRIQAIIRLGAAEHAPASSTAAPSDAKLANVPEWYLWFLGVTTALVPVSEGLAAYLCYGVHKEFSERAEEAAEHYAFAANQWRGADVAPHYGATGSYSGPGRGRREEGSIEPFSGQGHRLGG